MFLFSVLTTTLPSELFGHLISNSLFHDCSGNLAFFRESLSRSYKSNIVSLANAVVPEGILNRTIYLKMHSRTKYQPFKLIPHRHQQTPPMLGCEVFSVRWSIRS